MSKKKDLIEKRAKTIIDAQALANSDNFCADKQKQFDTMMDAASDMQKEINRIERADAAVAALSQPASDPRQAGQEDFIHSSEEQAKAVELYNDAFDKYLRLGVAEMGSDEKKVLQNGYKSVPKGAMTTTTGSEGGYTVPEGFNPNLEQAELEYNGVVEAGADVLTTETGADIPWPTQNDTSRKGRIITQNSQANDTDMDFGNETLKAYTYTSDIIKVPNELLQDSAIDLNTLIPSLAGERIGRILNEHYTLGSGNDEPQGIVPVANVGVTSANADKITFEELRDMKTSVKKPYRKKGVWMFNDNTLNFIAKMKDGENRPLFLPSMRDGDPDRLLGRAYFENDDMDDIGSGNKPILYGDFTKYKVRRVNGATIRRLSERFADYNQTAFIVFVRADGRYLDAGTHPIKSFECAA